jgi:HSP20 family protein
MALVRYDPFRELDRLTQSILGGSSAPRQNSVMAMDAWRRGDQFIVRFDLPGVSQESIDVTVEKDVLTVTAERRPAVTEGDEILANERGCGTFTRQLLLGSNLNADGIQAEYRDGVLELTIPVSETAKPRRVAVNATGAPLEVSATAS